MFLLQDHCSSTFPYRLFTINFIRFSCLYCIALRQFFCFDIVKICFDTINNCYNNGKILFNYFWILFDLINIFL
jgi:hypothetical protein